MRYKYVALLALIIMLVGVMGIYNTSGSNNSDDERTPSIPVTEKEYFVANHDLFFGDLVTASDFSQRVYQSHEPSLPQWLNDAIPSKLYRQIIQQGAIVNQDISKETVLTEDAIVSLAKKISDKMVALPISVNSESIKNVEITDGGFVDVFLISNDDKAYNADIYHSQEVNSGEARNYMSTRVKKFATKVWITLPEQGQRESFFHGAGAAVSDSKQIVRAWFNRGDEEKVIQAQILGSFFVLPVQVNNYTEGWAEINTGAREITAADIVSGAPLAEKKSKIIEIRGAINANRNN